MGRAREAAAAFGEGLKADPLDLDLKRGLQDAERAVLADLVEGAPAAAAGCACLLWILGYFVWARLTSGPPNGKGALAPERHLTPKPCWTAEHTLTLRAVLLLSSSSPHPAGRGRETRAIEFPDPAQRITYHPCATPLHRVRTDDMLPVRLLTPFQAENDHHIKDTYNYVTVQVGAGVCQAPPPGGVSSDSQLPAAYPRAAPSSPVPSPASRQADIKMPKRQIQSLGDAYFHGAFEAAISAAVASIAADDRDCRVLDLGAGAGLHAMMALRAGAVHVTAVERWLYLALAAKEALVANQVGGGGGGDLASLGGDGLVNSHLQHRGDSGLGGG